MSLCSRRPGDLTQSGFDYNSFFFVSRKINAFLYNIMAFKHFVLDTIDGLPLSL